MTDPLPIPATSALSRFRDALAAAGGATALAQGLIGKDVLVDGPFGPRRLVYADYVASGRALRQVEGFVMDEVLPYYANSHTEASYCGARMTTLRREARAVVAAGCGAGPEHAVIFAGSGATAGINRLVALFGLRDAVAAGQRVRVLIGPYEHHSNILPWRESGAEVLEVPEGADGGACPAALARMLDEAAQCDHVIFSFSAMSNVTGITCDVAGLAGMAKAAGAMVVCDYAGGAPYLPVAITPTPDAALDALVLSPHKFLGGPGASGILVVRRDAVRGARPTWPGGGTVRFVSPEGQDYSPALEAREEAGTPNVIGDIRAALAFLVKEAIGPGLMADRNAALASRALAAWRDHPRIELLGHPTAPRVPVFSFRIRDGQGGVVHQQLITRMLSDCHGIQARGGCACAGPYVHRLLGIDPETSDRMRAAILAGQEVEKPGFTRLNLSVLMSDETVAFILDAVVRLAEKAADLAPRYDVDAGRAIFSPRAA
ncbi:aminotransferase class V-fold PLP-dependent enzyme [Mesobaculum littorinae]|uniref:Aminotransferase class V-fold PLP-dependent enzyme n=1 Tax=Mesobaculum littorinae TaxID=2486419 RepID=A0A438AJD5_9RHOB|nr:aminotransferase class V-fold PLP-dependent enzyme [Mesobaculum littorinae]RVV98901.1 aminotransferase class V-fold PLP-dependent enzyme [Mesobaculum littorinae]